MARLDGWIVSKIPTAANVAMQNESHLDRDVSSNDCGTNSCLAAPAEGLSAFLRVLPHGRPALPRSLGNPPAAFLTHDALLGRFLDSLSRSIGLRRLSCRDITVVECAQSGDGLVNRDFLFL
jgi:hypothetical protein